VIGLEQLNEPQFFDEMPEWLRNFICQDRLVFLNLSLLGGDFNWGQRDDLIDFISLCLLRRDRPRRQGVLHYAAHNPFGVHSALIGRCLRQTKVTGVRFHDRSDAEVENCVVSLTFYSSFNATI
jgi:hypothetical protein